MNVPTGFPLPQNSADPPTAEQITAMNWDLATYGAGIQNAQAAQSWTIDPATFSGVSPLAPTVVAEAQQTAADQQVGYGMLLAPAANQMAQNGAVITDDDLANAPEQIPLNTVSDSPVVLVERPQTVARRHRGVRWGDSATVPPPSPAGCNQNATVVAGTSPNWKWLWILLAVVGGVWLLSDETGGR